MTSAPDEARTPDKGTLHKDDNPADVCLSLENYPPREDKRLINSPRSLEACKIEGILPQELLYK